MRYFLGKRGWRFLLLACLLIPFSAQATPQADPDSKTKLLQKPKKKVHQPMDPTLWQIDHRSPLDRRQKFLQEIRKLYQEEEGPGI